MQWTKPNRKEKSPNLVTFIDHFEFTSSWVMREILKESDLDVRVVTLSHIIHIADVCPSLLFILFPSSHTFLQACPRNEKFQSSDGNFVGS